MDKNVLAAVIGQDEAEAARWIVPFDDAVHRFGRAATAATAAIVVAVAIALPIALPRRTEAVFPRCPRCCRREVKLDHRGDGAALGPLRPIEDDRRSIRQLAMAGALQHRERQEHVAAAVIGNDEAKPLAAIEPFNLAGQPEGFLWRLKDAHRRT